jgi:hypothetical protein
MHTNGRHGQRQKLIGRATPSGSSRPCCWSCVYLLSGGRTALEQLKSDSKRLQVRAGVGPARIGA